MVINNAVFHTIRNRLKADGVRALLFQQIARNEAAAINGKENNDRETSVEKISVGHFVIDVHITESRASFDYRSPNRTKIHQSLEKKTQKMRRSMGQKKNEIN